MTDTKNVKERMLVVVASGRRGAARARPGAAVRTNLTCVPAVALHSPSTLDQMTFRRANEAY